eukprot:COSAG01_NODE_1956_length_8813_cov_9.237434_7_plen_195_part_00
MLQSGILGAARERARGGAGAAGGGAPRACAGARRAHSAALAVRGGDGAPAPGRERHPVLPCGGAGREAAVRTHARTPTPATIMKSAFVHGAPPECAPHFRGWSRYKNYLRELKDKYMASSFSEASVLSWAGSGSAALTDSDEEATAAETEVVGRSGRHAAATKDRGGRAASGSSSSSSSSSWARSRGGRARRPR